MLRSGVDGGDPLRELHARQDPDTGDHGAAREAWLALVSSGLLGDRGLVRVSHDGASSYPARYERPAAGHHPAEPAACFVYDSRGLGRMLVADFDTKRHPPWQAAADAAGLRWLIERCGGTSIEDLSPTGGRHVYVPLDAALPFALLKRVAEALYVRMTGPLWHGTFDKSPMMNAATGLIRPPGSPHPTGGYQALVTPLPEARRVATRRNDARVWDALLTDLAPELEQVTARNRHVPGLGSSPAARGQRRDLPPAYDEIARTGRFDPARYPSRSEARLAVLRAARACHWSDLDEVIGQAQPAGPWAGLGALYAKYRAPATRRRQWERDWAKAAVHLPSRSTNGGDRTGRRNIPTRQEDTPPHPTPPGRHEVASSTPEPAGPGALSAAQVREWGFIRCAVQAIHLAEACGRWDDRAGLSVRLVLRAAARAAMLRGDRRIAFGTRFLGLDALLDRTTVGHALRRLREEHDPFLVLIDKGHGVHADRYAWRIPDQYAHASALTNPLSGKIDAIHPVFRTLGVPAALVYEALDTVEVMAGELARATRLSPSAQRAALYLLAQVGLAERGTRGWHRGSADPGTLACALGADQTHRQIAVRWADERAAWQAMCTARPSPDLPTHAEGEAESDVDAWRRAPEHDEPPRYGDEQPDTETAGGRDGDSRPGPPAPPPPAPPNAAVVQGTAALRNKAAFGALPHLHRAVLTALFRADQAAERTERARKAAGEHSRTAAQWRPLDVTDSTSPLTAVLGALAPRPQSDAAIDALERAGLLATDRESALFGGRMAVRLSRRARTLVRAGLAVPAPPRRPPGLLSRGLWRCLDQVAATEPEGLPRHLLWKPAALHLAAGAYHRPGKRFIALSGGRWHLTALGDEHIEEHRTDYARSYPRGRPP